MAKIKRNTVGEIQNFIIIESHAVSAIVTKKLTFGVSANPLPFLKIISFEINHLVFLLLSVLQS